MTMLEIRVKKASGETEPYDPLKVIRSCRRTGMAEQQAIEAEMELRRKLYDGITTAEIYAQVKSILNRMRKASAMRYGLKKAIMRLGPSGFPFEDYFSEVLKSYGYATILRAKRQGACAVHEIDVIAERPGENGKTRILVECKYHNAPGIFTGLKEALYTYARFIDLKEGNMKGLCEDFDAAWLVSNTKCSEEAQRYSHCRGVRLIAWNYPPGEGLESMIESKLLYPITILESVSSKTLSRFVQNGITLLSQIRSMETDELRRRTKLPIRILEGIKNNATSITLGSD